MAFTSALLPRNFNSPPLKIVEAQGPWLVTESGRKILDASSGAAVSSFGPGPVPQIEAALRQQRSKLSYVSPSCTTPISEIYGRELVDSTNGDMERVVFYSSGSAGMEAALKLTRQYYIEKNQPDRTHFIGRRQSYHGTTFGSLSVGYHHARRTPFESSLMESVSFVSACHPYREKFEGETDPEYVARLVKELEDEIQRIGPTKVAAFIVETVPGATLGASPAIPGYFTEIKRVCDKYDIVVIADEVMSGMGRSGTLHAWQGEGFVPNIAVLGKGLAAGFAEISAMLMDTKIARAIEKGSGSFTHGHTFQNSPTACAAGLQTLRIIQEQDLASNAYTLGNILKKALWESIGNHRNVGDIRGKGLILGVELVLDKQTKRPFPPHLKVAERLHKTGLDEPHNIHVYPGISSTNKGDGDHFMVTPPLNITSDDVSIIVDRITSLVNAFFCIEAWWVE